MPCSIIRNRLSVSNRGNFYISISIEVQSSIRCRRKTLYIGFNRITLSDCHPCIDRNTNMFICICTLKVQYTCIFFSTGFLDFGIIIAGCTLFFGFPGRPVTINLTGISERCPHAYLGIICICGRYHTRINCHRRFNHFCTSCTPSLQWYIWH